MNSLTSSLVIPKSNDFAELSNKYRNYVDNQDYDYDYNRRRDNYSFLNRNYYNKNISLFLIQNI